MMQLDRMTLGRMAKEMGFVRDTLEKVSRLANILKFMEEDELLSKSIALKGGTAINLAIFDLPRLSVDIDLDYCKSIKREEMLADRKIIADKISKYMKANEYTLSLKSKTYHALDSFMYEYVNAGGVRDNLKIEINYMLRCHVLPVTKRKVKLLWNPDRLAVFYSAIGAEKPPEKFEIERIGKVSAQQIKRELNPVLRKGEKFDLEVVQKEVKAYLTSIMIPTEAEENFWRAFAEGDYSPELVFGESQELQNISEHPMALWKCRNK